MAECIFCGKNPESKTKEHVFPLWLLELTGNISTKGTFGFDLSKNPPEPRIIPFKSFQFPACNQCNQSFKLLENNASKVIKKMTNLEGVSEQELNILFNWFDKVRRGLNIGFNTLDSEYIKVYPPFYIQTGVGLTDRLLQINVLNDDFKILAARGCDSFIFKLMPSCILLFINNLCFVNIAMSYLFSRRLGFPYASKIFYQDEGQRHTIILKKGEERIMYPLVRSLFKMKGIQLYQPMFPIRSLGEYVNYYESQYVKDRSLDWSNGVGKIFISKNRQIKLYDNESEWITEIFYDRKTLIKEASIQLFNAQRYLIENFVPSPELLSKSMKNHFKKTLKICLTDNSRIMKKITEEVL